MPLDPMREGEAIASLLLQEKRLTVAQLEDARREAAGRGGRLATVLYALGAVDLGSLVKALADAHDVEAVPPERMAALDPKVVQTIPKRVCLRALAIPVRRSERGLDVAFVDPADEVAIRDVQRASADPVTVVVTAEPLVWYALRVHGITDRIPPHLAPLVEELVSAGLSSAPKRTPVTPKEFEEFNTTPLGGVAPHSPDDVGTASLARPDGEDPEENATPERTFATAESAIDASRDAGAIASALVAFARTGATAAGALHRVNAVFELRGGTGAVAEKSIAIGDDKPTVLTAALAGETGFRGAVPASSASLPLFEGRTPHEILLLALSRSKGREVLLFAESADAPFDPAFVERLRVLARRARSVLE